MNFSILTISIICIFLFVIFLIFLFRNKLQLSKRVKVRVNNSEILVQKGLTLFQILNENKISISSICGGGGNCGKCKCKIEKITNPITSSERELLSENELNENWRLACQIKVDEDLDVFLK